MSETMTVTMGARFTIWPCASCGIRFGVPEGWGEQRRKDKGDIYCPNGHVMNYRESEADKLRSERDRLAQQIAQRDDEIRAQREMREAAERSAAALKGQITKLNKRTAAGVCPCCNRTFTALHRHMKTKHPDFNVVPFKAEAVA